MKNGKLEKDVLQFMSGFRLGREQARKDGELHLSVGEGSACMSPLSFLGLLSLREKTFLTGFLESGMADVSSLGVFSFVNELFDKASIVHCSLMS